MSEHGWSDPRVDLLKRLWQDGLSASQIAKRLGGVTRNAVIGKVHRPRFSPVRQGTALPAGADGTPGAAHASGRENPDRQNPGRQTEGVAGPPTKPATTPVRFVDETPGSATRLTLGAHMCKWPFGDPLMDGFTCQIMTTPPVLVFHFICSGERPTEVPVELTAR